MKKAIKLLHKKTKAVTHRCEKLYRGKVVTVKKIHPKNTILIAGSGRSGTTWLANIIAACQGFGIIFEPFDYRKVPEAKDFSLRTYLRPGGNYPEKKEFVEKVLSGRIHNTWTDRENKNFLIWKYLVKSIRANLFLAWIDFNFHCPIIYMVRHPCAVVLSRLKLKWNTHLDVFLNQEKLMKDYLYKFKSIIDKATTPIQKHTIMWCVENLIPLSQFPRHDWIFCAYENLCNNTIEETDRILERLGIKRTPRINQAINGFYQTRKDSAVRLGKNPVYDWQNQLSKTEIADILSIVNDFGIELYGEEVMPNHDYFQKLEV